MSDYLKNEWTRWKACKVNPDKESLVTEVAAHLMNNKTTYEMVAQSFGCPFWVIGAIHYREASFNFHSWLANGDPLFDHHGVAVKTVHVPSGLGPAKTWHEAAVLSLKEQGFDKIDRWNLACALYNIECYNGLGYAKHFMPSPYIWASTNQYQAGLYVADGQFDSNKVDERLGVAAIAMGLKDLGIDLNEIPL